MKKRISIIFLLFLGMFSSSFAILTAEVTSGVIAKPLATVASNNIVDDFALDVNKTVTSDLNNNGEMNANDEIKYEVKQKHDISWQDIRSDYVVLAKYSEAPEGNYNVEVSIYKRNDNNFVRSITYRNINPRYAQILAHKIANYVYKALTGKQGFFLTKIAYVKVEKPYARYGRIYELIIADYDGNNQQLALKQTDNPIATPSWSHDGKYILYSSYSGGGMGVYSLELATGKVKEITKFKGINSAATYSPNDRSIALALSKGYSEETNIYIMNLANKSLKQLTINGINTAPSFSPDGKNVAFTSDRGGKPNLYVADVYAKYPQSSVLTTKPYQAYEPNYTPDGRNIVFMYQRARGTGTQIAKLDLSNNSIDVLTSGKSDASPTVAPFGDMAAYVSTKGSNVAIKAISLDGDKQFVIDSVSNSQALLQSPAWSPKNF